MPLSLLCLLRSRGWCVQPRVVCLGRARDLSRPGTGTGGLLPYPGLFLSTFPGPCVGERRRVKSSMHMAPLFTTMKEGGHYLSVGSLLDTLWCHTGRHCNPIGLLKPLK